MAPAASTAMLLISTAVVSLAEIRIQKLPVGVKLIEWRPWRSVVALRYCSPPWLDPSLSVAVPRTTWIASPCSTFWSPPATVTSWSRIAEFVPLPRRDR